LVEDVKLALGNDLDDEKEATLWVQNLGQSIMKLIESERDYQKDPDSRSNIIDVGRNAQDVSDNCVKVLTALNAAAKRAQVLDNVSKELSGLASDLETTIMFASAGTMNPENEEEKFAGMYRKRKYLK
jgi:talin